MIALLSLAVTPKTDADRSRLLNAMGVLQPHDPALSVGIDESNNTVIIGASGEQHLEIIVDRCKREFGVEAFVGRPCVNYVETITGTAEGEAKYVARVSEDRCEYAHVKLRVSPLEPASGLVFENAIAGGAIQARFVPAIEEGVLSAARRGILAASRVVGVRVLVHDGSYHDIDSTPAAFKNAAAIAFDEAVTRATPVLLEPIMMVTVSAPANLAEGVRSSLTARGARSISGRDRDGAHVIAARVPLAAMFGYAADLRARTSGRGSFTQSFDSYAPLVPGDDPGDRQSFVGAPLRPDVPRRNASAAVPEPDDDRFEAR
jgi:elongation factor G